MTETEAPLETRSADPPAGAPRPGDLLEHPLVLAMLALWLLNDHVLKDLWANELTGKLSDVAGLAVFPLIPYAIYEMGCGLLGRATTHARTVLLLSMLATGSVMVGINVWDVWADAYRVGLGLCQWPFRMLGALVMGNPLPGANTVVYTMDPTDLLALPALYIPYWVFARTRSSPETSPG